MSWKKLPNDEFGVRVWDGPEDLMGPLDLSGQTVTVTAKNGRQSNVQLLARISVDRKQQVYSIVPKAKKEAATPLPGPDVVPAGRYAFPVDSPVIDGPETWMFVKIWRAPKDKSVVRAYMCKGTDQLGQGEQTNTKDALDRIVELGPTRSAQEFGWRTGNCGRCGTELDVNLSRKLGLGPVCLKKQSGPEKANSLRAGAREELRAKGIDPDAKFDPIVGV
jgi:hypothetical protein